MMEIDLEERIKPGILFLNILGYELALPKVLNKWESMDIINAKNIKIGNAYFAKTYFEMMGEEANIKFLAKYNLKRNPDEDKITSTITRNYYNTSYRFQLFLSFKSVLIGKPNLKVKMQVFANNHQEFSLLMSDSEHNLVLDSLDEGRGKEHIEISHDEKQFTIFHQEENKDNISEIMAFYPHDARIYTISKTTYENGEDVRRRFYPLTKTDNPISTISYYLNEIDPIFKIPFWQLNDISKEIFKNLIMLCFPEFTEEDLVNLFGITKKDKELTRILEK